MNTNSVSSATAINKAAEQHNSNSALEQSGLDVNDFLKLLIAQISNQDPMGGSSSGGGSGTDYISQLAQFTMLQQISSLSANISSSQAYSLIGKYVYLKESPDSELIFGKVDGVIKENGINYLMVGGETYEMSKVYAVASEDEDMQSIDDQVLGSAYLIGKQVTAVITAETGEETTVTGTVERIRIQDGVVYLVIDGSDVKLSDITEISEAQPATETI